MSDLYTSLRATVTRQMETAQVSRDLPWSIAHWIIRACEADLERLEEHAPCTHCRSCPDVQVCDEVYRIAHVHGVKIPS